MLYDYYHYKTNCQLMATCLNDNGKVTLIDYRKYYRNNGRKTEKQD